MKKISILSPCFNEAENLFVLHERVCKVFEALPDYDFELVIIDNDSKSETKEIIRELCKKDKKVKAIFNSRNFGHIRSPYHGILQTNGDATILMASDLQDPPEVLPELIKKWEEGNEIVIAIKNKSEESPLMFFIRKLYYTLINRLAEIKLAKNYTGFGLYDRRIIEILRTIPDPYPYLRGLIFEVGFNVERVYFEQPTRKRGVTSNNFYSLYDMAMLGICSHSKVPLRLATMLGFAFSMVFFILGFGYLVYKLLFWNEFALGVAPVVIGIFFFASIQLLFIGIIGEYIAYIATKVTNRPPVIERMRLNFDE